MKLSIEFRNCIQTWRLYHSDPDWMSRLRIMRKLISRYGPARVIRHEQQIKGALDKIEKEIML